MNIFDLFKSSPFVNMHEVNLDWILSKMKECLTKTDTAVKTATDVVERLDSAVEKADTALESLNSIKSSIDSKILLVSSDEEMRSSLMNLFNEMPESTGRKFTVVPYNGYENTAKTLLCEFHKFSNNNGVLDMQFWEDGCVYKQKAMVQDGALTEFEWVNPPYKFGIVYRTTERYKGLPVYAIEVSTGGFAFGMTSFSFNKGFTDDLNYVPGGWNVIAFENVVFHDAMYGNNAADVIADYSASKYVESISAVFAGTGLKIDIALKTTNFGGESTMNFIVKFVKSDIV